MTKMDWKQEILKRKEAFLDDTVRLLKIESVLDEESATEEAPLGKGVKEALDFMLKKGKESGFSVKNVDNLAGHIEYGDGKEMIGILCHLDVVPAGDGWTYPPFGGTIEGGRLYGRGSLDDKGPTMAAFYALKAVKESGLPLSKRIRLILGTDEESHWRCVTRYFEKEEMPTMGFAPDADFPIIIAEKGIADFDLLFHGPDDNERGALQVERFAAGRRYNMVPDWAEAQLAGGPDLQAVAEQFSRFLKEKGLSGDWRMEGDTLRLQMKGKSAHAMEPFNGVNAALHLAAFLAGITSHRYFSFIRDYLFDDVYGNRLGISGSDDISGRLTVNAAIFSFENGKGKIGLNFRYPVTYKMKEQLEKVAERAGKYGFSPGNFSDSRPHYVDSESVLVKTLKKVYEEQTGKEAKLLAIGGGTYARSLQSGVAFGPLFPGRPDTAHQANEFVEIDDLLEAAAIYARAIYELAK